MKIYNRDQLVAALKEAGFTEIKTYINAKNIGCVLPQQNK